jgi:hypothetical protein
MEVDGRLEGLQAYEIHGTRYYRVFYTHLDEPDEIQNCQLPFDAIDAELKPGDQIQITYLLKTVMAIHRIRPSC